MKPLPRVFVDSDVVISSTISKSGAAYYLISRSNGHSFISNLSRKEIRLASKRLEIDKKGLSKILKKFKTVRLSKSQRHLKLEYNQHVTDPNDSHIVAGAVAAKARFLISYNLRHFKIDRIKRDFGILLLSPAMFLQYLRSKDLG